MEAPGGFLGSLLDVLNFNTLDGRTGSTSVKTDAAVKETGM